MILFNISNNSQAIKDGTNYEIPRDGWGIAIADVFTVASAEAGTIEPLAFGIGEDAAKAALKETEITVFNEGKTASETFKPDKVEITDFRQSVSGTFEVTLTIDKDSFKDSSKAESTTDVVCKTTVEVSPAPKESIKNVALTVSDYTDVNTLPTVTALNGANYEAEVVGVIFHEGDNMRFALATDAEYGDLVWYEFIEDVPRPLDETPNVSGLEALIQIRCKAKDGYAFYYNDKTFIQVTVNNNKVDFLDKGSISTGWAFSDGNLTDGEEDNAIIVNLNVDAPGTEPEPTPAPAPTNEQQFNAYKVTAKAECDKLLTTDDSDAVKKLVTDAKTAIDNAKYDTTKTLADNKIVLDGIVSELKQNVMEQRADEELTRMAKATKGKVSKVKAVKRGKNKLTYKVADKGLYVAKYQIYRSTKKSSGFKKLATTSKKTYTDSKKLKKGKKYYYKVRGMVKLSTGKYTYTKFSSVKSVKSK
ncbi:MAG: hypothetical protein KBS56_01885 [Clostridiales bacterium]|nr:hypothetical protein [Candidatus Crickella equi]